MTTDHREQLGIASAMALLIFATHGHHNATASLLPPATWAMFFLTGFYLRSTWAFTALLAEVVAIDYFAITTGGVSSYCISPAYGFLLPAYGTLWLAGRWFANRYRFSLKALPALAASLMAACLMAEIFSSGSFYFVSSRFADTSLSGFGARLIEYLPQSLAALGFWMGIALVVHALVLTASRRHHHA